MYTTHLFKLARLSAAVALLSGAAQLQAEEKVTETGTEAGSNATSVVSVKAPEYRLIGANSNQVSQQTTVDAQQGERTELSVDQNTRARTSTYARTGDTGAVRSRGAAQTDTSVKVSSSAPATLTDKAGDSADDGRQRADEAEERVQNVAGTVREEVAGQVEFATTVTDDLASDVAAEIASEAQAEVESAVNASIAEELDGVIAAELEETITGAVEGEVEDSIEADLADQLGGLGV